MAVAAGAPPSAAGSGRWLCVSMHSHSGQFCCHASGTLAEMVASAIGNKMRVFGLSEHMPRYRECDLYPEEIAAGMTVDGLSQQFGAYVAEARRLQAVHASEITLLVGMETELCRPESIADAQRVRAENKLDYVVGSVHHVNGIPIDFSQELFDSAVAALGGFEPLALSYFKHVRELIEGLQPEVVGHLDLLRLFLPDDYEFSPAVLEAADAAIRAGVAVGSLFEINTSGLRKKLGDPYPARGMLQRILEMGGRVTLSDDSHNPTQVAVCYGEVLPCLEAAGVRELHYLLRDASSGKVSVEAVPLSEVNIS
eukprot:m.73980 g.73980  ORF g.73980 m.73980 type:complete len:311 (-) comp8041_c1_seq4:173-1105(-)